MDIIQDIKTGNNTPPPGWSRVETRVETERSGPFFFTPGADPEALALPLQRVMDAHERFRRTHLAQVAVRLEREVLASSIFGTNTIEGGTLSEEETARVLDIPPEEVQSIEERRVRNIRMAYDYAREAAQRKDWRLSTEFIREVHARICDELPHERNRPGLLRDNPKSVITRVGDADHGGVYKPPQSGRDIRSLLSALCEWHEALRESDCPAPVRAPLAHLYFELIHPFWDGNGRVGRVLEAAILLNIGFRYAPFAMARYYLEHIHQYFALFNQCRKAAEKKRPSPNQEFLDFHLVGLLASINRLHDRVNAMVANLIFMQHVRDELDSKKINKRQYAIVDFVMEAGRPVPMRDLRGETWYQALYDKLTDKTRRRDLDRLKQYELIQVDRNNRLWPGHVEVEDDQS